MTATENFTTADARQTDQETGSQNINTSCGHTMLSYAKLDNAIQSLGEGELKDPELKNAVLALKDLQFEHLRIEESYRREWNEMKLRYLAQFQPLYEKRREILTGNQSDVEKKKTDFCIEDSELGSGTKCLPSFWLKAMKNHPLLDEMIEESDVPILKYLEDITFSWVDPKDQTSFKLGFYFAPNPFFKDEEPSEDDDEESVLTRTIGSAIEWYPEKNVTEKTVTRRQRNKRTNRTRVINEKVKVNSFFNFFNTHEIPNEEQLDKMVEKDVSELEAIVEAEFVIGTVLRDKIIPRALGWYLGIEHDDMQSDEADLDDFDEDEEDDDDLSNSESSDDKP